MEIERGRTRKRYKTERERKIETYGNEEIGSKKKREREREGRGRWRGTG